MDRGRYLNPGEALRQAEAFNKWINDSRMPRAVCYRIDDLIGFLSHANEKLKLRGVPLEQRGIALVPGVHLDQSSEYAKSKVTIMLVATQFQDMNHMAGRVDMISNSLFKTVREIIPPTPEADQDPAVNDSDDEPDPPKDVDDDAYDAGSLWP
jgi:hypothetical protein